MKGDTQQKYSKMDSTPKFCATRVTKSYETRSRATVVTGSARNVFPSLSGKFNAVTGADPDFQLGGNSRAVSGSHKRQGPGNHKRQGPDSHKRQGPGSHKRQGPGRGQRKERPLLRNF